MELWLGRRVESLMVRGGVARGVVLSDGTQVTSRVVVSDINAKTLYLEMVGEEHLGVMARKGIKSYELSVSAPVVFLGLDYEPPLDAHHSLLVAPMEKINRYWWNNYRKGRLPDDLFGLACWHTRTDPSLAPAGHHAMNVILAGPYRLRGSDWDSEKEPLARRAIEELLRCAIPGLADHE